MRDKAPIPLIIIVPTNPLRTATEMRSFNALLALGLFLVSVSASSHSPTERFTITELVAIPEFQPGVIEQSVEGQIRFKHDPSWGLIDDKEKVSEIGYDVRSKKLMMYPERDGDGGVES